MKKLLALSFLLTLASTSLTFAQVEQPKGAPHKNAQNAYHKEHNKKPNFEELETKLNLTEEQKAKIKALKEKEQEEAKPIFEQLKQKHEETAALKSQLREIKAKYKKDFEAILDDKQLEKLNQIKAERKKNFEKNMKKHNKNHPHKK